MRHPDENAHLTLVAYSIAMSNLAETPRNQIDPADVVRLYNGVLDAAGAAFRQMIARTVVLKTPIQIL
jgi:hypothetical protein